MSVRLMALVYGAKLGGVNRKAVALKLADCAEDDGTRVWPSINRIAKDTEVSRSTVDRVMRQFRDEGFLIVIRQGGGTKYPTNYKLNLIWLHERLRPAEPMEGQETEPRQADVVNVKVNHVKKKGNHVTVTHNPSLEPSQEKERDAQARPRSQFLLPSDWKLPEEWGTWALKESPEHKHLIDNDAKKFKAHWRGEARVASEAQWQAAWEKWWLRTIERPADAPRNGSGKKNRKPWEIEDVSVRDTSEPIAEYTARMIREGKYRPNPTHAKD